MFASDTIRLFCNYSAIIYSGVVFLGFYIFCGKLPKYNNHFIWVIFHKKYKNLKILDHYSYKKPKIFYIIHLFSYNISNGKMDLVLKISPLYLNISFMPGV
mgnify:CR=1 FL=1